MESLAGFLASMPQGLQPLGNASKGRRISEQWREGAWGGREGGGSKFEALLRLMARGWAGTHSHS